MLRFSKHTDSTSCLHTKCRAAKHLVLKLLSVEDVTTFLLQWLLLANGESKSSGCKLWIHLINEKRVEMSVVRFLYSKQHFI